jgi:lysophospholipase L1-like esterase
MKEKKPHIWEQLKKPNGTIFDAYHNTYVAAMLAKSNLSRLKGYSFTIQTSSNTAAKSILAMGDSITAATNSSSFTYMAQIAKQNSNWSVKNAAVGGKTTIWMLQQMKLIEKEGKRYDTTVLLGGTNDISSGFSKQYNYPITERNLRDIIEIAKRISGKVVVISPPHQTKVMYPAYTDAQTIQKDLESLNNFIKNYPGITVIDYYSVTKNKPSLIGDGIHPTSEGQKVLKELVFPQL